MKTMGFISVILALFLISFNCNIKLSTSRKNVHLDSRNFITIATNSVGPRSCTCIMPSSCSCCEIVKIFYTGDERRLCFNMVYQRNGLNFDLSLDSTIIKSMTVANYRPFQMCASVPGLLLTSICVNVLDINQLSGSVVVCPRLEVSTKLQRWHISYTCQNVSTNVPTGIAPLTGAGAAPMQVMMMPGMMPAMAMRPATMMGQAPGVMMMVPMMPAGGATPARPPATPGVMMMVPMMPTSAGGATPMRPAAPPMPGQQMMPIAGMMIMGMRPAAPAMMPAAAPAAGAGARPPAAPAMMPAAAPAAGAAGAAGARPPAAPGAMPPAGTPAAPGAARPPGAPAPPGATPPMGAMMVPPGVIVPRPADGLVYSLEPLFRSSPDDSSNFTAQKSVDIQPIKREAIRVDSTIIPAQVDHVEQPSSTETDTDSAILDYNEKEVEVTTETVFEETTDDEKSTIEDTTESERAESSRILKRRKRQYDIFDIFHQSNRCERAYRICITRSNNYIVSRLRTTRFSNNKNKNMDCNDRPTKIVHGSGDNLCSYSTSTSANDSGGGSVSFESNSSNSQNSDTLDAIIVHDDSEEDSDFYSQNYPQIASITPYNKPRVFPARTPPLIASQLKEHLENLTNDTLIIGRM